MDLDELVGSLRAQVPSCAEEVAARVWGVVGYDDEHMSRDDLADRVPPSLRLILELMLAGDVTPADAREHAAAIGEARALQGVPVEALLYSWLAGQRLLLARLLDHAGQLSAADLQDATSRLLAGVELLMWHSVQTYRRTQDAVAASYDDAAADLVVALAGPDPPDAAEAARRARLVGARTGLAYTAIAVGSADGQRGLPAAQRHVHRFLRARLRDRVLAGQVPPFALLLVPAAGPATGDPAAPGTAGPATAGPGTAAPGTIGPATAGPAGADGLGRLLRQALDSAACPPGTLIGRGETVPSLAGAGPSLRQARQAAEVAVRLRRHGHAVSFADVIPEVLLLRNPELARALLASRLGPLQGRPELLETLSAYLRNRLSVRRTAAALTTHPNTVLYRLKRLREVLGRDFGDVQGLADLVLALRAGDLSLGDRTHDDLSQPRPAAPRPARKARGR